jgi:hypothetical protein
MPKNRKYKISSSEESDGENYVPAPVQGDKAEYLTRSLISKISDNFSDQSTILEAESVKKSDLIILR